MHTYIPHIFPHSLHKGLMRNHDGMKNCISILCFFIFSCGYLPAQDEKPRQTMDDFALEYQRVAGAQAAIYSGTLKEALPRATNHPFLVDEKFAKARLSYLGVVYPEVLLRLDLSRNELTTISPAFYETILFPENVDFAELNGWQVIFFQRDALSGSPATGYYNLLHAGKCRILEKQTANLMVDARTLYYSFTTRFYLKKNDIYYTIRNKRGLLKVLQPYKKELKSFISAHHLKFRNETREFLIQTVSEFEKLSE